MLGTPRSPGRGEKEAWEAGIRQLAEERDFKKAGDLFMLLRVAVTGRKESPPLHDTMLLLGRETTLARMDAALAVLRTRRKA